LRLEIGGVPRVAPVEKRVQKRPRWRPAEEGLALPRRRGHEDDGAWLARSHRSGHQDEQARLPPGFPLLQIHDDDVGGRRSLEGIQDLHGGAVADGLSFEADVRVDPEVDRAGRGRGQIDRDSLEAQSMPLVAV